MAFLFLVRTPLNAALAYQKSPDFSASVLDLETNIATAQFQLWHIGELDSVLSHTGKYNAARSLL